MSHLQEPLRLENVSRAACLSPFHFHRVFQMLVGMTLAEFVKQRRFEKALNLMAHCKKPALTKVALECGFSSSSDFSRCFKQQYGVAPSVFDIHAWQATHRSELYAATKGVARGLHIDRLPVAQNTDGFRVRLRELPARTVAYIRVMDPYQGNAVERAVDRLMKWAERHSLADGQWLGYQWENPEIVSLKHCHYHVAVEAERFVAEGEIGRFHFPAMVVAQVEVRGDLDLELRALQWLYGAWLPASEYVPDDHPCFEAWIGRPFAHGKSHFELHAMLPVRREKKSARRK